MAISARKSQQRRRFLSLGMESLESRRVLTSISFHLDPYNNLAPGDIPGELQLTISGGLPSNAEKVRWMISSTGNFDAPQNPLLPESATMWEAFAYNNQSYSSDFALPPNGISAFWDSAHHTEATNTYQTAFRIYSTSGQALYTKPGPNLVFTDYPIDIQASFGKCTAEGSVFKFSYVVPNGSTTTQKGLDIYIVQSKDRYYSQDDTVLKTVSASMDMRTRGEHTLSVPFGPDKSLHLPGDGLSPDSDEDYYLLGVIDPLNNIGEDDADPTREDNSEMFVGSYQATNSITGSIMYRHAWDYLDVITINVDALNNTNQRLRTHGGNDTITLSASTSFSGKDANILVIPGDGNDSVTLNGTPYNDNVTLRPYQTSLTNLVPGSGRYTQLRVLGAETEKVWGLQGDNSATFYDSNKDDRFTVGGTIATMTDTDATYSNTVMTFQHFDARATGGGYDVASLNGNDQVNTLVAGQWVATLTGGGLDFKAQSFERVNANGQGGNDTATLNGSDQDDYFVGATDHVELHSAPILPHPKYFLWATRFGTVLAKAGSDGNDRADLYDTTGDDVLVAGPASAHLKSPAAYGLDHTVNGFDKVYAHADKGGNDYATLHGSKGSDQFQAAGAAASISGQDFFINASKFDQVFALGDGGDDKAEFYDTPGNDTFSASPTGGSMWGSGYANTALAFNDVLGVASKGGTLDKAIFNDSSGVDHYVGHETGVTLTGTGFVNAAAGFVQTILNGGKDGSKDTAELIDSAGKDWLTMHPRDVQLTYASGRLYRLLGVERVEVTSNYAADDDVATMYDGPGEDKYVGSYTGGVMQSADPNAADSYGNIAEGKFEHVKAIATVGGKVDTATLQGKELADDVAVLRLAYASIKSADGKLQTTATGFEHTSVDALSPKTIGGDKISFDGTSKNDTITFTAFPRSVEMKSGAIDEISADRFGTIDIYSLGGDDTATLTGSTGDDSLAGYQQVSMLTAPGASGYRISVHNFATVSVDGNGGNDTAVLVGTTGQDLFYGRGNQGKLTLASTEIIAATGFSKITAKDGQGGPDSYDVLGLLYLFEHEGNWKPKGT